MFLLFISHALPVKYRYPPFHCWSRVALELQRAPGLPRERLVPSFLLPLHKMTSGNSSLPPIMYYALLAESPLQLIANPGRTRCLSIRTGVVTRNCIFHDLIWAVNLSARTVAFDLRGHAKRPAGCFFFFFPRNTSSNPPCDRSRQQTFKITISHEERLKKSSMTVTRPKQQVLRGNPSLSVIKLLILGCEVE